MIILRRNKIKNIVLILLIVLLLIIVALIFYNNGYFEIIYKAMQGEKTEKNIIDEISINNVTLTYDKENNIYYFPIIINEENKDQQLEIKIKSFSNLKCKIEDKEFSKTIDFQVNLNYDKVLEINVESLLYKYICYIKFSNLPIICLNYDEDKISAKEYTYSQFSLIDPNYKENYSQYQFSGDSKVRYRGCSTLMFNKKSYRVKLDKNITSGFLGMRVCKTWILDSIATDSSRLRTKISSDLWGNINKDIDNKKYTKLNSKYVEVYVNGKYNGLYLLKEVIDEDFLNLDKNTGVLVKGINKKNVDFTNYYNITSDFITPFELKYPRNASKYSKAWIDILDKLKDFYTGNINYDVLDKMFYVENFINYRVFILILKAEDNYEFKNVYCSIQNDKSDTKVLITPWDLDLTIGGTLSRTKNKHEEIEKILDPYGIKEDNQIKKCLKDRWEFLSNSELSKEKINNMIDTQYEYLTTAQALQRENIKYYNVDIEKEFEEIKDLYSKRFDIIDEYINSL